VVDAVYSSVADDRWASAVVASAAARRRSSSTVNVATSGRPSTGAEPSVSLALATRYSISELRYIWDPVAVATTVRSAGSVVSVRTVKVSPERLSRALPESNESNSVTAYPPIPVVSIA
jgi:hypothetical protein